ncbi:MAG: 30S ribosomal protein S6 [Firmicutes bacterium]|nr:30S ribosomal protein S6 [Bacillota bacterium]
MRNYELIYVVKPDLDEEALNQLQEKITSIITQQGGQTTEVNEWGKRRLAYEINDYREGVYVEVSFVGNNAVVQELDRVIKITDSVIRHLIVRPQE